MPYIVTPNMNLQLPVIGEQPGPDYALNQQNSMLQIDQHDHSEGRGVQLTPDSLDFNTDTDFQINNLLSVRSVRFESQVAPLSLPDDLDCVYVSGVDLYYNDGDGNQIRLTESGAIVGTDGSIANLVPPASASYEVLSESFIWRSDVNKPATMDAGSIIIREEVASGFGVTIEANASIAGNYTLTLPAALPATTNALTLTNTAGAQSYLSKGAANQVLRMDSGGTNLGYGLLNSSNLAFEQTNYGDSLTSGAFTTNSTSFIDVTNQTASITSTGRLTMIVLLPDVGSVSKVNHIGSTSAYFRLLQDGVDVGFNVVEIESSGAGYRQGIPPAALCWPAVPSAGAHTFTLQAAVANAGTLIEVINCNLIAYEIK